MGRQPRTRSRRGLGRPLADGLAYTLARVHDGERITLTAASDAPPLPPMPRTWAAIGPEPAVMGILNVTPDSFSDGGDYFDPAAPSPPACAWRRRRGHHRHRRREHPAATPPRCRPRRNGAASCR